MHNSYCCSSILAFCFTFSLYWTYAVIGRKLQQNANESCNSCARRSYSQSLTLSVCHRNRKMLLLLRPSIELGGFWRDDTPCLSNVGIRFLFLTYPQFSKIPLNLGLSNCNAIHEGAPPHTAEAPPSESHYTLIKAQYVSCQHTSSAVIRGPIQEGLLGPYAPAPIHHPQKF